MAVFEDLYRCSDDVWHSRKARKKQIRALVAASHGWPKRNIVIWRDCAEFGWDLGVNTVCKLLELPQIAAAPSVRALAAWRDQRVSQEACYVARATGGAMAVAIAKLEAGDAPTFVSAMLDPNNFVDTCSRLLDDGARKMSNGGPVLDTSDPMDLADIPWVSLRRGLAKIGVDRPDLSSDSRPFLAPI